MLNIDSFGLSLINNINQMRRDIDLMCYTNGKLKYTRNLAARLSLLGDMESRFELGAKMTRDIRLYLTSEGKNR